MRSFHGVITTRGSDLCGGALGGQAEGEKQGERLERGRRRGVREGEEGFGEPAFPQRAASPLRSREGSQPGSGLRLLAARNNALGGQDLSYSSSESE